MTNTISKPNTRNTQAVSPATKPAKPRTKSPSITKRAKLIKALRRANGANIEDLVKLTGWQQHSIRGFISGTLKKKEGLIVSSFSGKQGERRYRIEKPSDTQSDKTAKRGAA